MSISKFTKVESLFRTTLAAGISSTASTVILSDAPGALTQFPQWYVIEPLSSNYEIIFVASHGGGVTLTGVVRGINPNADTDLADVAFQKAHAANVDVILAPMHRHWNELVKTMDGTDGTGATVFRIGDETDVNITIFAQNADVNKPFVRYDAGVNKWLISNDGTSTFDITAGGSGLVRGLGVDIIASAITLDIRATGGLRNNQGTGSQQCDVDPAIVARLDTANTWANVQTTTADNLQITTDPNTANDAARKSYVDNAVAAGASSGTSGEAITVGQAVYVKASDGFLYRTDTAVDESTYSFMGFALETVGAAGLAIRFAGPGDIATGLAGLTISSYYFLNGAAGAIAVTPATPRLAKIGQATSATTLRVIEPYFSRAGSFAIPAVAAGTSLQTTGFYPTKITLSGSGAGTGVRLAGFSYANLSGGFFSNPQKNAGPSSTTVAAESYRFENDIAAQFISGGVSLKTQTNFTLSFTNANLLTGTVFWLAESS